jgi:hypothetical protein
MTIEYNEERVATNGEIHRIDIRIELPDSSNIGHDTNEIIKTLTTVPVEKNSNVDVVMNIPKEDSEDSDSDLNFLLPFEAQTHIHSSYSTDDNFYQRLYYKLPNIFTADQAIKEAAQIEIRAKSYSVSDVQRFCNDKFLFTNIRTYFYAKN